MSLSVRLPILLLGMGLIACDSNRYVTLDLSSAESSGGGQGDNALLGGASHAGKASYTSGEGAAPLAPTAGAGGREMGGEGGGSVVVHGGGAGGETADLGGSTSDCVDCPDDAPFCAPIRRTCVECLADTDCGDKRCEIDLGRCVDCFLDRDCEGAEVCDLLTFECTNPCTSSATCSEETPLCHPNRLLCVECVGDTDCEPLRCHPRKATCVECVEDTDCGDGGTCDVEEGKCSEGVEKDD